MEYIDLISPKRYTKLELVSEALRGLMILVLTVVGGYKAAVGLWNGIAWIGHHLPWYILVPTIYISVILYLLLALAFMFAIAWGLQCLERVYNQLYIQRTRL